MPRWSRLKRVFYCSSLLSPPSSSAPPLHQESPQNWNPKVSCIPPKLPIFSFSWLQMCPHLLPRPPPHWRGWVGCILLFVTNHFHVQITSVADLCGLFNATELLWADINQQPCVWDWASESWWAQRKWGPLIPSPARCPFPENCFLHPSVSKLHSWIVLQLTNVYMFRGMIQLKWFSRYKTLKQPLKLADRCPCMLCPVLSGKSFCVKAQIFWSRIPVSSSGQESEPAPNPWPFLFNQPGVGPYWHLGSL